MLPENKTDFPKCLYLDQNFWIGLAQAAKGLPAGNRFSPALEAVKRAVDSGKLITPLSLIHIIETSIPGSEERRIGLMEFMLGLARGKWLAHYKKTRPVEIENAVRRWGGATGITSVRPLAVGDWAGVATAADLGLGDLPADQRSAIESAISSPARFQALFQEISGNRDAIKNAVTGEVAAAEQLQKNRELAAANLTDDQRELLNFAGMYSADGAVFPELVAAVSKVGIAFQRWTTQVLANRTEIIRFSEDVPFINVFVRLNLIHGRNLSRAYEKNDMRDLVWLAGAIPYCNIVAGETYWTTMAAPLGRRYSTVFVNKPEELPHALAEAGC